MCGIFCYLSDDSIDLDYLKKQGNKCLHRGPDNTQYMLFQENKTRIFFMFHRLSINGIDEISNQPFNYPDVCVMCNGEIYNYKQLADKYNITLKTNSDCEILVHLYRMLGIQMISLLDGVFSFVILDKITKTFYVGHDPIGIRSLYMTYEKNNIIVSSEMKCLTDFNKRIDMVSPGIYHRYNLNDKSFNTHRYYSLDFKTKYFNDEKIIQSIYGQLYESVKKRLLSDRPVGCLLSGGLDSSIIVSLMCKIQDPRSIQTFSIGFDGSPDLLAAQKVAEHLNTNHTSVIVTEQEMLDAIVPTIYQIESYDTTTVRASVPMYLLSKYIKENTDVKVILSGEGSDELSGSYLYFHKAPNPDAFQNECIRLVRDVQYFDVLRGDKTTAGNSLEIRVPFFDKTFVKEYMSIDPKLKVVRNGYEKYLLRKTFENDLPEEIVWRRKDGFSDGVSKNEKPWYQIINDYTQKHHQLTEKEYYLKTFKQFYKDHTNIVPYEWLPKWCEESNPSGRLIL